MFQQLTPMAFALIPTMTSSNLFPIIFFLLFIFTKLSYHSYAGHNIVFCPEIEKQALLDLKQALIDPSDVLSLWIGKVSCCNWKGVVCSNLTGHVQQLNLRDYDLVGKLSYSLLHLKHLRYLDLSGNDFSGQKFPSFFGSFASLEYLNLTHTGFHGTIPHAIGNLSSLKVLSTESWYGDALDVDSLEWLHGLHQLEHLNMNYINLNKASGRWVVEINRLPSLVELHLQSCGLDSIASLDVVNITSLAILDLPSNSFSSIIPEWISHISELIFLDLSGSGFEGPIPGMNATNLQDIDLSENHFNSTIPDWIYFCKDVYSVSLANNFLHGRISSDIGKLSSLNLFDIHANQLSGKIPQEIGNLSKLQFLDLFDNKLQGDIPYSFGNLSNLLHVYLSKNELSGGFPATSSSLRRLDLSSNNLKGNLPDSLGQLGNMEYFSVRFNMFEGMVSENHLDNLTELSYFGASGNHITLKVKPSWIPPFQLQYLLLGSWNLGAGTQIPSWIEMLTNLVGLELSDTGISGSIPGWIWRIPYFDLSHNNLHGNIPDIDRYSSRPGYIFLSSNQFNGSLPRATKTMLMLDLSNNSFTGGLSDFLCDMENSTFDMAVLLLGGNQLSGELPDCWMKWPSLRLLNLSNNNLFGSIPSSMGSLAKLLSLNLYGNHLSGQIPDSLMNCTTLQKIDLGDNDLKGSIPAWMGTSLPKLRFLILRSNKLSGAIPLDVCHLMALQILDLSNNKLAGLIPICISNLTAMAKKLNLEEIMYLSAFQESASISTKGTTLLYDTILTLVTNIDLSKNNLSGEIPEELTSLVELRSLDLSKNHLTGPIPHSIGNMKQLESVDLSRNTLSGNIPNGFTVISSLSHLNLSYNSLTGRIPTSTQMQLMDPSSFVGNSLCGPPLPRNCSNDHDQSPRLTLKTNSKDNKFKVQWIHVFMSLGYAVGLSVVCTILVLKKSWRDALFRFVENEWNMVHDCFNIKWKRLQSRWDQNLSTSQ